MQKDTLQMIKEKHFSLTTVSKEEAVRLITDITKERRYWYTQTRTMLKQVPTLSAQKGTSYEAEETQIDIFYQEKIDEDFMQVIFKCLKRFDNLALYIEYSHCMFHPVFSIVLKQSLLKRLFKFKKEKKHYLLKFKESNLSTQLYEQVIEHLYSKQNIRKHFWFGLPRIGELHYYES